MKLKKVKLDKPKWEKSYRCTCQGHRIEFAYYDSDREMPEMLCALIYDCVSKDGSRFIKKGKLIADVVLSPEDMNDLRRMMHPKSRKRGKV